jgi:hypothetical protein
VLTCFKNDEIFAWHTVGLRVAFKLMPPREKHSPLPHYRTFSVTRDGRTLVAAGRSQFLAVYRLADAALHRTVKLPGSTQGVKQVEFLWRGQSPDRQVVAVLCDTGRVEIIDIDAATLLCSVGIGGAWSFIDATAACLHGRYLAAVHANGSLKIHNVDAVLTVPSAPPLRPSARAAPAIASSTTRPAWASTLRQNEQIVQPNNASVRKVKPKGSAARWKSHIQQAFSDIREDKLHDLLMGHGEYPAKYRKYIWRQLLQVPENADVYVFFLVYFWPFAPRSLPFFWESAAVIGASRALVRTCVLHRSHFMWRACVQVPKPAEQRNALGVCDLPPALSDEIPKASPHITTKLVRAGALGSDHGGGEVPAAPGVSVYQVFRKHAVCIVRSSHDNHRQLVPAVVRVLPEPTCQRAEHGGERAGAPRAAASPSLAPVRGDVPGVCVAAHANVALGCL